ncbi:alpha/beta hydrolase (plasmid) [Streptomyces sp. NBC_01450]|uniref:alpha/beta fold hydrolase n=1 Tax=Streptomyces sp. NBC_01450 TaxID=2903871 RepID=UPI002E377B26|nr:alpha/beta hydrolase [Streptomyces sp. NBC_01450]
MTMSPMEPPAQEGPGSQPVSHSARRGLSRRGFVGGAAAAAAAAGISLVGGLTPSATASPAVRRPRGFGSVSTAPGLPAGFTKTFTSRFIQAGGLRQHAVIGGDGPPLLLVHGWPQNWYAWRMVMPELARHYTVIAVDQRGIGLTGKPMGGYDTATLANDLVALMDALGHDQFAVVGHDTGMVISYALAADHPERVARVALLEVPGPPMHNPSPSLFSAAADNDRLWHIAFNRVNHPATEKLVRGREDVFFGYEFDIQGGKRLSDRTREYYYRVFSDPETLRGSFGLYRAWDATLDQNDKRAHTKLTMPVLAIGGKESWHEFVAGAMKPLANDVQGVVIPDAGHWVAEQAPKELLTELTRFLTPYRRAAGPSR